MMHAAKPETAVPTRRPQVGEIWREVHPRFERWVSVTETRTNSLGVEQVRILTVTRAGPNWVVARGTYPKWASLGRFNGKRGGYEFVESAP